MNVLADGGKGCNCRVHIYLSTYISTLAMETAVRNIAGYRVD